MADSKEKTSLGDLVVEDLERQLGEGDPRFGTKCRELAMVRSQYRLLAKFVEDNAEVLGLQRVQDTLASVEDSGSVADESPAESVKS